MKEYKKSIEYFKNKLSVEEFIKKYQKFKDIAKSISTKDKDNDSNSQAACSEISALFHLEKILKPTHIKWSGDQDIGNHHDGEFYMQDKSIKKIEISSLMDSETIKYLKKDGIHCTWTISVKDYSKKGIPEKNIPKENAVEHFILNRILKILKKKNDPIKYKDATLVIRYDLYMKIESFKDEDTKKNIFSKLKANKALIDSVQNIFKEIWFIPSELDNLYIQGQERKYPSFCLKDYI